MAEIKYLSNINVLQNQLIFPVVHNLAAAPTTGNPTGVPVEGQLYMNTVSHILYVYDGTVWVDLTNPGYSWTLTADTGGTTAIPDSTTVDIAGGSGIATTIASSTVTVDLDISSLGAPAGGIVDADSLLVYDASGLIHTVITAANLKTYINASAGTFSSFDIAGDTGTDTITDAETVTHTGDVGIVTTVATGVITFSLDFTELTDMIGAVAGTTEIILNNAGVESRKAISEIDLSAFNNDAFLTSNVVSGGTGITVVSGGTTFAPTYSVAVDYLGVDNIIDSATNLEATPIDAGDTIMYHDATDNNVKKGFVSDLPFDPAGTDNSTDVTLAGVPDYITISGQVITRNLIDLTTDVTGVLPIANFASIDDDTFATASATTVPTSESVKAYVDSAVTGALVYQGGYNASTDTPSLDDGTPIAGILTGWTYTVTVAGDFFTEAVQPGDMLIAQQDSPTLLTHWTVVNKNIPDIVDASETAKGLVEEATDAEVTAGTATGSTGAKLFVTPAKLQTLLGAEGVDGSITRRITFDSAAATTTACNHGFNNLYVVVQVYEVSTGLQVMTEVDVVDANNLNVNFNTAATLAQYKIIVIG